jgi:hypothetical protein
MNVCILTILLILSIFIHVDGRTATMERGRTGEDTLDDEIDDRSSSKSRHRANATDDGGSASGGSSSDRLESNDARRRRKQKEREREGYMAAKATLQAGSDEACDWKTQPLSFLKGEVCGAHYKVLGLDRKNGIPSKAEIKKAYRQRSLSVHPDKNPSPEATAAFKVVQEAYECLSDDACRNDYEVRLAYAEHEIAVARQNLKMKVMNKVRQVGRHVHYYATIAAQRIYQSGMEIWDLAGEIEVEFMGENRPLGKILLMGALLMKGRILLQLHAISYALLRFNYELSKGRGMFDY